MVILNHKKKGDCIMKRLLKPIIFGIILLLMVLASFKITTHADTGPKPSVSISIKGETNGMYLTLLSKTKGSGPWHIDEDDILEADAIDTIFNEYANTKGFYYLFNYSKIDSGPYNWGYYPPTTFMIVIYDSINDNIITDSKEYTREHFKTIYKLTLTNSAYDIDDISYDSFKIDDKSGDTKDLVLGFILRLVICLLIEIIIAFFFKFIKLQYVVVLCANILTQVILNLTLLLTIKNNGFNEAMVYSIYAFLEILIIGIEWLIYILLMNKANKENMVGKLRLFIYSLTANLSSFLLGFIILELLEY